MTRLVSSVTANALVTVDAVLEFTGERVVPGQVNDDLWAEHLARYAWAVSMAHSTRALEIACGSGYGAKALSQVAQSVTAIDIAADAVRAAAQHYSAPNISYAQASASALPFRSQSFDLITAFEVIEHLEDWPNLIQEAARVLKAGGTLLVSTPNKSYYAESRATHGPNPFHAHEFEYAEFRDALLQCFAHVCVFRQDRLEAFAFYESNGFGRAELNAASERPEDSHFYVGVCSNAPLADIPPFLYAPRAVNLLRERERHIALLEEELAGRLSRLPGGRWQRIR